MNIPTARIISIDSPNRSKLAIAVVSALALVMALLTPAIPANATGSGSITSVAPTSGPAGTTVTITGDVAGVTQVLFGTLAGTSLSVAGNGQSLSVVSPTQTTGSNPYLLKLVKADGSVTLNSAYSYRTNSTPSISSVSPTSGSATGYTAVTISGSSFTGTTAVRFGTTNAVSFSILSDSRIVAYAPEGTAGATARVYVQNGAGTTTSVANYKYKTSTCAAGTYLTTKFGSLSSTLTKKQKREIREAADDFVSLGCEQVNLVKYIGVRAGSSATYKAYLTLQNKRANAVSDVLELRLTTWGVPISVTKVKRATQKSQARKASPDSLVKYRNVLLSVPSTNGIEVVYPNAGPTTGGSVVITGKGFTNVADTGAVKFGSNASPSYTVNATGTKITATVPAGVAGNTNVTVQTGVAGTSTAKVYSRSYSYVAAPTITTLGTTSGSILGGTSVTITGTGFTGVTAVRFGSSNAVSYTVNSATSITAVTPPGAAGAVTATVVAAGGSIGSSFSYVSGPSITSMAWTGPGTLTITGTQLSGASLTVEGSTISISNTSTATSLIATGVVEPTTTSKLVTVTTSAGVATKGIVDPVITEIAWSGTTLTITGTGLAGANAFTAAGAVGGTVSSSSSTSVVITGVTVPPNSDGIVTVTTPLGTSANANFTKPVITSATWAADTLTVNGRNLATATSLTVGGVAVVIGTLTTTTAIKLEKTGVTSAPANNAAVVVVTPAGTFSSTVAVTP